jgi:putative FmdB family regulatory protein
VPIYEYQCDDCGSSFEVIQKMSDEPLAICEKCGGSLRKVLHPVAIHFKGSGFYTTDYGKGSGRRPAGRESAEASNSSESSTSVAAEKPAQKPAAEPAKSNGKPKEKQKAT